MGCDLQCSRCGADLPLLRGSQGSVRDLHALRSPDLMGVSDPDPEGHAPQALCAPMQELQVKKVGKQVVKFHRCFGRFGVMFSTVNEGERYGLMGSQGKSFHLVLWRDSK